MYKIIYATLVVLTGITVSSCRNSFDFDEAHNTLSESLKQYNENFTKLYGEVDPDQNWDFSSYSTKKTEGIITRGDGEKVESTDEPIVVSKRYMIEDLGATSSSDIDFNDIVVDLIQIKDAEGNTLSEKAIIRALGGTLNFNLLIGTTTIFTKKGSGFDIGSMYNTGWSYVTEKPTENVDYDDVLKEIDLSNYGTLPLWNGDNTNIHIEIIPEVEGEKDSDKEYGEIYDGTNHYAISFPGPGEVPQMIAFDTNKHWRKEKVSIKGPADDWWGEKN